MKNITFILSLLALQLSASAQSYSIPKNNLSKHTLDALSKGNTQNKTSAAKERLSATATYTIAMGGGLPSLELNDSTRYKYSNDRGSSFESGMTNTFNLNEYVLFDSSWNFADNGNGMELSEVSAADYNTTNKRTALTNFVNDGSSKLVGDQDIRYEYNTAGNVSVEHTLEWNSSTSKWDSVSRVYYDYNTQNKLETVRVYDADAKQWDTRTTNHYDGAGNIDTVLTEGYGTTWAPMSREIHTFTTGNKLSKSLTQVYDDVTLGWKNQQADSFGYSTGVGFFTFFETKQWDTLANAWVNSAQQLRTLNAQKLIDAETYKSWDTAGKKWDIQVTMKWAYNANNNPVKTEISSPLFPLPIPVSKVYMYYETYFNTSVATLNRNAQFTMYPNPATDNVTVRFDNNNTLSATVSVVNMAGQVMLYSKRTLAGNSVDVSLLGLQAGAYNVSVQLADGSIAAQRIIKQ